MHRNLGIALVAVGLLIMCIPQISAMIYNQKQIELEAIWKSSMNEISLPAIDEVQAVLLPESIVVPETTVAEEVNEALEPETVIKQPPANKAAVKNIMGLLKISSINLEVPILKGTTKANLNLAVTTVEPTGGLGEIGNFALAGHNNYEFGRNFNRLGEVVVGDSIEVQTQTGEYRYLVTNTFYVNPDETWVLLGEKNKSMITLITCYPRRTAEQRLIVQGELQ